MNLPLGVAYEQRDTARVPPHSLEAEGAVVGGLMLSPASLSKVSDWLAPEDFYSAQHRAIYRGICSLVEQDSPADAVTLGEWAEANNLAEAVGGVGYLVELASNTPSAANIVAYGEIVKERARLRAAIEVGLGLTAAAFRPEGRTAGEIVAVAAQSLSGLQTDSRAGGLVLAREAMKDWFDDLTARYENGTGITGLPYPWHDVNKVTHGLQDGEVTIIAARPSMGKSVMGLNLATFSALRGVQTAFFSLEMTLRQVNRRNVSNLGNVPHDWLLAPDKKQDDQWTNVNLAVQKIRNAALLVDESAGLHIDQVCARARRAHLQKPIRLLVIDHLHEVAVKSDSARFDYGYAVGQLKALGKEFGCPVVILAQLNRGVESRSDKRPGMADLRESGEIEQKADVIWFLYREDYYRRNDKGYVPEHDVELILAKGRDLRVGAPILLREEFEYMRLSDWIGEPPQRQSAQTSDANKKRGCK